MTLKHLTIVSVCVILSSIHIPKFVCVYAVAWPSLTDGKTGPGLLILEVKTSNISGVSGLKFI